MVTKEERDITELFLKEFKKRMNDKRIIKIKILRGRD